MFVEPLPFLYLFYVVLYFQAYKKFSFRDDSEISPQNK